LAAFVGRISTVVIGVGGFLGMGASRVINVALNKHDLTQAPQLKATERTTFERAKGPKKIEHEPEAIHSTSGRLVIA
jgi:hypothetical protein